MNRPTIYARTDKGTHAAAANELAGDLRKVLDAIDGSSSVDALQGRLEFLSPASLFEALATLVADDMIRDVESLQTERKAQELRAKLKARREGAERSPQDGGLHDVEAEEQARREVAENARQEAEAQARRLAEEKALREAAERARQEAEAQAKRMAAELARRDAEEQARREAEAQARKLAEEQELREAAERARQDAEAKARRIAEELAQRDVEEQARRQADERARHEAEERARVAAEEKAWREAEEKYRREEQEAKAEASKRAAAKDAKAGSAKPRKWGLPLAIGLVAVVVIALAAIHLISYDGQIPAFEKAAAAQFQQPVKIKAIRLSLLPQVGLRLEDVTIGAEGQIRIPRVKAAGDLGNLFSDKKLFKSVELDSPVVTETGLGWILFGKSTAQDVVVGQLRASNVRLESKNLVLPAVDAKFEADGAGAWKAIVIESADKAINLELTPKGESVLIDFKARSFKIPFGSDLALDELVASGTANRSELVVTEFKGFAYGGILAGNARLKWGAPWSLSGELNAKQIDTSRILPGVVEGGRLVASATYSMQAQDAGKLFAANHLEGSFTVARGSLAGVDLGRLMQGGAMSGETKFTELAGGVWHDRGATQLRQVRLNEGAMSASGAADVDPDGSVRGRFAVELRMSAEMRRANLVVAGTVKKIEWRRP